MNRATIRETVARAAGTTGLHGAARVNNLSEQIAKERTT